MQIAGIVPLSSVDWPDKLVATVFTQGCPWDCLYCHNRDLIPFKQTSLPASPRDLPADGPADAPADGPAGPGLADLFALLERRRGLLDGLVISGGEPLAHVDLPDVLARVRSWGFKTGLHTGGAWPNRLKSLLEAGLVDWVGLDVKALPHSYERVVGRRNAGWRAWESLGYVLEAAASGKIGYEVRVTWFREHPDALEELTHKLHQAGVNNLVVQLAHLPARSSARGIASPPGPLPEALLASLRARFANFVLRP